MLGKKKIPRQVLEEKIVDLEKKLLRSKSENDQLSEEQALLRAINESLQEQNKSHKYEQVTRSKTAFVEENFYQSTIDIPSIKSLAKGWDIKIQDWERYVSSLEQRGTIVAVVGTYNKGKTYILGKLSETELPEGFNVNTQGLSILYLKSKDGSQRPIIGLDSKGSSLPLDISSITKALEAKEKEIQAKEKISEMDQTLTRSERLKKERLEENELKDLLRDHEATEDIIQNFIMEIANIIIVVVSDLNFDDQKLVNKIKRKFQGSASKKIIVVHNLYHTHYIKDVEYKINEFIKKGFMLDEVQFKDTEPKKNRLYFVEKISKDEAIPHIVIAKEYSEAGNYYNEISFNYIKQCISTNDQQQSVDIVKKFYLYLKKSLFQYIKSENPNTELTAENLDLYIDENGRYQSIRLVNQDGYKLKSVFADEFGNLQIFREGFQPRYALYEEVCDDQQNYLTLKIECPEKCIEVGSRIELTTEEFKIQIKGVKAKNRRLTIKEPLIADTRLFGQFYLETDLYKRSKYQFDYNEPPKVEFIDGVLLLRWKLRDCGYGDWITAKLRADELAKSSISDTLC